MLDLHENLLQKQLTYYEYRLIRSVYFSTLAEVFCQDESEKTKGEDYEDKTQDGTGSRG